MYAHHLFQMPPLNPYGGIHPAAFRPPVSAAMQKVASMPILGHPGMLSPQAAGEREGQKRRAESPIPEDEEAAAPAAKKRMTEGPNAGSTSPGSPQDLKPPLPVAPSPAPATAAAAAEALPADGGGAAALGGELARVAVKALSAAGGSSENGCGKGVSHDTERLVDAMMSDGVGTMLNA